MEGLVINQEIAASILLWGEDLPGVPAPSLVISLPIDQTPGPEQIELLGKIRKAIGVPAGLVRFRYYGSIEQERLEKLECPIHFIFMPSPSGLEKCNQYQGIDGAVQIEMPALGEMILREDLKREVWKTIRPLVGR